MLKEIWYIVHSKINTKINTCTCIIYILHVYGNKLKKLILHPPPQKKKENMKLSTLLIYSMCL